MKKSFSAILVLLIPIMALGGCSTPQKDTTVQVAEEVPEQIQSEPADIKIQFGEKEFYIPDTLAIYHSANGMYPVPSDEEELFLSYKGQQAQNVCMLREAKLTTPVSRVEDADAIMKKYCDPAYYNSSEMVFGEIGLYDAFYTQSSVTTTLEDVGNSVFTLIPKNTNEIYSVTFLADNNGFPVCSTEDVKTILNSMQQLLDVSLEPDFFYQIFRQFLENQSRELYKYKNSSAVPVLVSEAFCDLDSDTSYYLGLETGLYTIETLEGEGEITLEDSRFGTRVMMLGYDSANAPIRLPDVTLVHGGGIKTNMGLRIRIVK